MKKTLLLAAAALIGFSASAEKHFFEQDRANWSITGCSQRNDKGETKDGGYAYIKDGNTRTFWHSQYDAPNHPNDAPHYLVIDRGADAGTVDGFGYQPRTDLGSDNRANGFVVGYKIYVTESIDGLATAGSNTTNGAASTTDEHASINTFMASNTAVKEGTLAIQRTDASTHVLQQVAFDNAVSGRYVVFVMSEVQSYQAGNHAHCAEFYLYDFREPTAADFAAAKAELQSACTTATSNLSEYFKDNIPGYYPVNSDQQVEMENKIAEFSALSAADADATWEQLQEAKASVGNLTLSSSNTDLSVANGIYRIANPNGRGYIYDAERTDGHVAVSTQTSGNYGANPADFSDEHAYWSVVKVGKAYYIYNVATKKFLVAPASQADNQYWTLSDEAASPIRLAASPAGYGKVEILSSGVHMSLSSVWTDRTWVVSHYAANDDGVPFTFERVGEDNITLDNEMSDKFKAIYSSISAILDSGKVYTITNTDTANGRGSLIFDGTNDFINTTGKLRLALDNTNPNHQWTVIKSGDEYYLYNIGAGKFANAYYHKRNNQAGQAQWAWQLSETGTPIELLYLNNNKAQFRIMGGENSNGENVAGMMIINGNYAPVPNWSKSNEVDGNGFIFTEVEAEAQSATEILAAMETAKQNVADTESAANALVADWNEDVHTNIVGHYTADAVIRFNNDMLAAAAIEDAAKKHGVIKSAIDYLDDTRVAIANASVYRVEQIGENGNVALLPDGITPEQGDANPLHANWLCTIANDGKVSFSHLLTDGATPEGISLLADKEVALAINGKDKFNVVNTATPGVVELHADGASVGNQYVITNQGENASYSTSGIREIVAEGAASKAIYDLQGRRVSNATKGIFIVNGKKALVK